jgi:hypothetical protein
VLERHGRDVHHASVLLAPPDLRRALELTLTNRVRCPVLSLTEIPACTEMALEVCLTLL